MLIMLIIIILGYQKSVQSVVLTNEIKTKADKQERKKDY